MSTGGATWGVSGPAFLLGCPELLLVAVFAVRPLQSLIGPRRPDPTPALRPVEIGLLGGGDRLAVATALGQLRAAGLVDERGSPTRAATPGSVDDPFDAVLLGELADRRATRRLDRMVRWPAVREASADVRAGLVARGWLRDARTLRWARRVALLPFAVLALGAVRVGVELHRQRPVGYLVLELLVALGVVLWVGVWTGVPPTTAARRELRRLRDEDSHLDPQLHPSWRTYGPAAAGLSVALWGTPALAAAEPAFAAAVAPQGGPGLLLGRLAGDATGLGSGGSGGSGAAGWFGGGSSCGGGGHGSGGGHGCGSNSCGGGGGGGGGCGG